MEFRPIFRILTWALRLAPLVLCNKFSQAKPTALPHSLQKLGKAPDDLKLGLELELVPEKAANLMPLFDFDALQATPSVYDLAAFANRDFSQIYPKRDLTTDYLRDNPGALYSLPAEMQEKLTKDLPPLKRASILQPGAILDASGQAASPRPGLITSSAPSLTERRPGFIASPKGIQAPIPKAVPAELSRDAFQKSASGLEVNDSATWNTIYARWKEIPPEERLRLARWELMGGIEKAYIFRKIPSWVTLKKHLSEPLEKLFLRLNWKTDADAIEFVYKEPVNNPEQLWQDLKLLSTRAGVSEEVFDPETNRLKKIQARQKLAIKGGFTEIPEDVPQWGSFHWHFSRGDKDLTDIFRELNLRQFALRMHLGITNDLSGEDQRLFAEQLIDRRGLIRQVNKGRAESRAHHEKLEDEINVFLKAIYSDNIGDGAAILAEETKKLLDPATLARIANSPMKDVLKVLPQVDGVRAYALAGAASGAPNSISLLAELEPSHSAIQEYFSKIIQEPGRLMALGNPNTRDLFMNWLKEQPEQEQREIHRLIAAMVESDNPEKQKIAFKFLALPNNGIEEKDAKIKSHLASFYKKFLSSRKEIVNWGDLFLVGEKFFTGDDNFLPVILKIAEIKPQTQTFLAGRDFVRNLVEKSANREDVVHAVSFLMGISKDLSLADRQRWAMEKILNQRQGARLAAVYLGALGSPTKETRTDLLKLLSHTGYLNPMGGAVQAGYFLGKEDPELRQASRQALFEYLRHAYHVENVAWDKVDDAALEKLVIAEKNGKSVFEQSFPLILNEFSTSTLSSKPPHPCAPGFSTISAPTRSSAPKQ